MAEQKQYPRLLVVSNNGFSDSDSNGRTLKNMLMGWPKDRLAQFYLQNAQPDYNICSTYFRVTDTQALQAFLGRGQITGEIPPSSGRQGSPVRKKNRNAATMLLRDAVWNSRRWWTESLETWLDEFAPDMILHQVGDCPFVMKIAMDMAERYQIPLVLICCEVYYFKSFDYFKGKGLVHMCYPVFRQHYRRQLRKLMNRASLAIYGCEEIRSLYDGTFDTPSLSVYTSTEVTAVSSGREGAPFTAAYLGNLGVGRHEVLAEIARTMRSIDADAVLEVYGKLPSPEVEAVLTSCPGISYRGFIGYEEVLQVMKNSDLLIHGENFSDFYRRDLQYAFSTKIADSLASGTCFLLYAPEELACSRYLRENEAAYVASDRQTLAAMLERLMHDPESRKKYIPRALALVEKNHRLEKNTALIAERLADIHARHRSP